VDFRMAHLVTLTMFQETPVNLRFKRTVYGLSEFARGVPEPVEEGQEVSLPLWLAREVVKKGYAEVLTSALNVKQRLSKSIWLEEQSSSPQKLDELFYAELDQALKDSQINDEQRIATTQKLQDFLRIRAKKLRRLAETKSQPDFLELLTPEEKAWFERYRSLFQDWIDASWFKALSRLSLEFWLNIDGQTLD